MEVPQHVQIVLKAIESPDRQFYHLGTPLNNTYPSVKYAVNRTYPLVQVRIAVPALEDYQNQWPAIIIAKLFLRWSVQRERQNGVSRRVRLRISGRSVLTRDGRSFPVLRSTSVSDRHLVRLALELSMLRHPNPLRGNSRFPRQLLWLNPRSPISLGLDQCLRRGRSTMATMRARRTKRRDPEAACARSACWGDRCFALAEHVHRAALARATFRVCWNAQRAFGIGMSDEEYVQEVPVSRRRRRSF